MVSYHPVCKPNPRPKRFTENIKVNSTMKHLPMIAKARQDSRNRRAAPVPALESTTSEERHRKESGCIEPGPWGDERRKSRGDSPSLRPEEEKQRQRHWQRQRIRLASGTEEGHPAHRPGLGADNTGGKPMRSASACCCTTRGGCHP